MISKKIILAALIVSSLVVMSGCSMGMAPTEGAAEVAAEQEVLVLDVITQSPEISDIQRQAEYIGRVAPSETVMVIPKTAGEVTTVNFEVGDTVNAGDVLFKMDNTIGLMQLEQSQLSIDNAQRAIDNITGVQYQSQLNSLETQLALAESSQKWALQTEEDFDENFRDSVNALDDQRDGAKEAVDAARAHHYDLIKAGAPEADIETAYQALLKAETTLEMIEDNLDGVMDSRDGTLDQLYQGLEASAINIDALEESLELMTGEQLEETREGLNAQLTAAQLAYKLTAEQIGYSTVTAPVSGVIQQVNVDVHGMASQQNAAFVIASEDDMTVTFNVPAETAVNMETGDTVSLDIMDALYTGTITEVSNTIDANSGLFAIEAVIQGSSGEILTGVQAVVTATTAKSQQAVTIPAGAVYYDNGRAYVFQIEDGKAKKSFIEIGISNNESVEVTNGLTTSSEIITSWSSLLVDGVAVSVVEVQ